ncbi:MAG: alkaline phosphatase family protein [Acidobacteria bacterium]|nr:MAG: alkaline phosphatase family protein [Acidobacteriota bacterium]
MTTRVEGIRGARTRAALVLAAVAAVAAGACSLHQRMGSAVRAAPEGNGRSVCVLFFDGLSEEAFSRLLAEGALPNLKRLVVDRSLRADLAVASIPSETYPNLAAMLTGLLPGHHGVPANIWLDRRLRRREAHTNIFRTYSTGDFLLPEARTLYERLPADTVAITTPISKGATVTTKNVAAVFASYLRNDWAFLDRKTLDDVGDAYAGAIDAGRLPSLVWAHLLGPDEVAHYDGPESAEFRKTLAAIDRSFGRLWRRLARKNAEGKVLFVLVGDHGNSSYDRAVSAEELVHRALFAHPTEADCQGEGCVLVATPPARRGRYDVGEAMVAVGAYRGAMVWLPANRPPEDLPRAFRTRRRKAARRAVRPGPRPPLPSASAFASALARMPELRLVVTRGPEPGSVDVWGPRGRAQVVREEGPEGEALYGYYVLDGEDPLGYQQREEVRPLVGQPLPAEVWLTGTARTDYPDMAVQLAEFFDSPRSPDVYLTPVDGVGFRAARAAGHGSLARKEMVVPFLFAGPGVKPGRLVAARTVDLAPTLLRYLDVPFDADEMDGEDLGIVTLGPDAPYPVPRLPAEPGGYEEP